MKYRNESDHDLIVAGHLAKAGETFESAVAIENPNFELVTEEAAAPVVPAAAPQAPAPAAPVSTEATS